MSGTERDQARALSELAARLSRNGYKGCRENGDVENCLTVRCPCGEAAMMQLNASRNTVDE